MYAAGALTNFYTDVIDSVTVNVNPVDVPVDNTTSRFAGMYSSCECCCSTIKLICKLLVFGVYIFAFAAAGPSKRWRHSMVSAEATTDPKTGVITQRMAIYGGHRLWQGYSPENSQDNNWDSYITRPIGGYLDDLWVYTKTLDFSFPGQTFKTNNGE